MVRFVAAILRPIGGFCPDGHWRGISAWMPILGRVAGNRIKPRVQTRGQAEKPNPVPSRDGDRALRPEVFPLERGAATPLLETVGELAAIFFLFAKM